MGKILYEVPSKFNFSIFIIPAIVIIGASVFPWILKKSCKAKNMQPNMMIVKLFCFSGVAFVAFLTAIVFIVQLNMYNKIVGGYHRGEYQIVEGYVEKFDPMPYTGHANESFEINGIEFSYSDYNHHPGYNNAKSHGGVIQKNGQHLRIGYVYLNESYGNVIVYIEQLPQ